MSETAYLPDVISTFGDYSTLSGELWHEYDRWIKAHQEPEALQVFEEIYRKTQAHLEAAYYRHKGRLMTQVEQDLLVEKMEKLMQSLKSTGTATSMSQE